MIPRKTGVVYVENDSTREPTAILTVDVNFDNITLAVFSRDGTILKLKRFKTPLRRIVTHNVWIKRIQNRYKSWASIKGVRRAVERHEERIRNITRDYVFKLSKSVVELASKYIATIVVEDLSYPRDNTLYSELSFWFYRQVHSAILYRASRGKLSVVYVSPDKTSSRCPKCGGKLRDAEWRRIMKCKSCGYVGDRDVIACMNLFLKYVKKMWGAGVALNAPEGTPVRGNKDEAMSIRAEPQFT